MSNRITICFASGDVMFEGESALRPTADFEEEECPPTQRSVDSGVFRAVPKGQRITDMLEQDPATVRIA